MEPDVIVRHRPVLPEDDAFLQKLYASTRAEEVALWGWPISQQELFLKMQCMAQQQSYHEQFPEGVHNLLLVEDIPIGQVFLHDIPTELHLVDISLIPEYQGRGIGSQLIQDLCRQAQHLHKPVRLQVLQFNRAQVLYHRLGFVITASADMRFHMEWRPQEA